MKRFPCAVPLLFTAVLVAVSLSLFFRQADSEILLNVAKDPFYRTTEELTADGVELVALADGYEEKLRSEIRMYYSTKYREDLGLTLLESPTGEKGDERFNSLQTATAVVKAYSKPRRYEKLPNVIGVFSSVKFYETKNGDLGGNSHLFMFVDEAERPELIGVFPVGEDRNTYEAWPIAGAKRLLNNEIDLEASGD